MKYCESVFKTLRWKTRSVSIGCVGVGGNNPIRIQSMTTSNTRDVVATIEQIIKLADVGCEIARVTVQGMKEAEACEEIKNGLIKRGYEIPLVADIHFFPPAALRVIDFVEKVRINPGNYVDKRASFKVIEYDDATYAAEIEKIEEKFTPLIEKCKRLKRAMRIGTNHGSLSDRIMNRYGDTPKGMIESAFEFTRICRKNDFHDIIFSMKSSNPQVMIQVYRLLVAEMMALGWNYPLHLGVTEAGEGEDGRIKSAMGIGSLLLDGIGDTIRVSLTEDPWFEIDPCQRLIQFAKEYGESGGSEFVETHRDIRVIKKRETILAPHIPLHRDGTVILRATPEQTKSLTFCQELGYRVEFGHAKKEISGVDFLVINGKLESKKECLIPCFLEEEVIIIRDSWEHLDLQDAPFVVLAPTKNRIHTARHFFEWIQNEKFKVPVILHFTYSCSNEDLIIRSAAECGSLLCDGLGDGLWLDGPYKASLLRLLSFNIMQAARMRTVKTDFISCPSCGRTLFNLQEVTKQIREKTAHLPGVKIAIMGCIVNGPGEMADADFGYVGSKPGKIDLYVGKKCVEKDIESSDAVARLIDLIKRNGRWIELTEMPQEAETSTLR